MTIAPIPLLLLGESDVGKTHYGAQLLRRLNLKRCALRMEGAAQNIEPFDAALSQISKGLSAAHTPERIYADSVWPVAGENTELGDLVWPDYGGEQIKKLVDSKKLPIAWRERTLASMGWVVMVRPTRTTLPDDALTRSATTHSSDGGEDLSLPLTGQARIVELLQILIHTYSARRDGSRVPPIAFLLTCFDELDGVASPIAFLREQLPLIDHFLRSNWPSDLLSIYGLSALGQALSVNEPDEAFANRGPEEHGFIVEGDGERNADLTLPLLWLLKASVT